MFSNDLHNAYAYECERRKDERLAAEESHRVHELLPRKHEAQKNLPHLLVWLGRTLLAAGWKLSRRARCAAMRTHRYYATSGQKRLLHAVHH